MVQRLYGDAIQIFENQITIDSDTSEECLNVCQRGNNKVEPEFTHYLRTDALDMDARARMEIQLTVASSIPLACQNKYNRLLS
jgi:hypothetical protein